MSAIDVHVFRDSVARIVRALTDSNIKVRQQGMKAYVLYDEAGKPKSVTLPSIPDNAPADLLNAIQGFLDHEVSHVLHTDFAYAANQQKKCKRAGDNIRPALWNVIEDVFVEASMAKRFKGSVMNLDNVQRYITGKMLKEGFAKLKASGASDADLRSYLMPAAIRAAARQPVFEEFMTDKWSDMGEAEKAIRDLGATLAGVKSTREAWDAADQLYTALTPPKPEAPPEDGEGEKKGDGKKSGEKSDDAKSKDNKSDDKKDAGDEKGDKDKPSDKGDKDKPGEDGEGEGDAEGEPPVKPENETDEGDGDHEQDESDKSDDDTDGGKSEDSGGGEDGESGVSDDGDDGEDGEGEGEQSRDRSKSPPASDEIDDGEKDNTSKPTVTDMTGTSDTQADIEDLINPNLIRPIEEMASEAIEEAIREHTAANPKDYVPFSRDYDYVGPLPAATEFQKMSLDSSFIAKHAAETSHVIQGEVERLFRARSASRWNPGQRRGKVNRSALHRVCTGDDRVFRSKIEASNREIAVQLVIDCSGSMNGKKIEYAATAAYMLAGVLDRIGVPCEVVGFTTMSGPIAGHLGMSDWREYTKEVQKHMYGASVDGVNYSRFGPICLYVFKEFSKRFDDTAKKTLGFLNSANGFMYGNADGESIETAAMRLALRREPRKVMIVMSDGQPAADGDYLLSCEKLKQVVQDVARSGMEIYGLGLLNDAVASYYPHNEVINNAPEIPGKVLALIQHLLVK